MAELSYIPQDMPTYRYIGIKVHMECQAAGGCDRHSLMCFYSVEDIAEHP